MTEYICKCGRKVGKSSKADNTGNRDTDGCDGCPYLMPWGEQKYNHDTKHFYLDVQGYECCMSHTLEYESRFSGSVTDKCSCYVASLDFDFLQRISDWIKATYPDGQISGSFSRDSIRSVEYVSNGRYRMAITCAQNKSGMAAKAALLHQFFDDGGNRLDLDPEAEKEKILQDIRRGIDIDSGPDALAIAEQDHEEAHKPVIYEDIVNKNLYRVPIKANADGVYPIQRMIYHTCVYADVTDYKATESRDSALAVLAARAKREGWSCIDSEAKLYGKTDEEAEAAVLSEDFGLTGPTRAAEEAAATEPTETAAPASGDDVCNHCVCRECDDERCLQAHCDCRDKGMGCWKPDDDCRHDHPELFSSTDKIAAEEAPEEDHPAEPAEEKTEITTKNAEIAAPETAPAAFDYSGLDEPTAEIMHNADRIMQTARRNYIFDTARGVKMAHDALASHYGGTFGKWCESYGMSRETANKLLQVVNLIDNSTSEEQSVLEQAPSTLLYAAAKPSAPAEAVEAVKSGDVTTMPEYKALLDQLARKDEAIKAAQEANEQNRVRANNAEDDYDAAVQRAETAERRAREAEAQRKNLQEAEAAHAAKIRELESRPVDVAVRKPTDAEIEQYRQEGYARAQKELAQTAAQNDDIAGDIADHAETVADSCAEALAGWFRLANNLDDDAYTTAVRYLKRLCVDLHDAIVNGAWPTSGDDDDDQEDDGE